MESPVFGPKDMQRFVAYNDDCNPVMILTLSIGYSSGNSLARLRHRSTITALEPFLKAP